MSSSAPSKGEPSLSLPIVWAAWTVPALLSTFETMMFYRIGGRPMELWRAFASEASGWYAWAALTPLIAALTQRFPLVWPPRARHVVAHVSGWLLVAAVTSMTWAAVGTWLRPSPAGFWTSVRAWFLSGLPFTVLGYAAVVGVLAALAHRVRLQQRERDAARLARELSEAQLAALRSQLHPHFLFNSITAITALMRDVEIARAVEALTMLSKVLRATLRAGAVLEVSLSEEVAFIRDYLDIERMRFSDHLRVAFSIPPRLLEAQVPTFILQPFVENAIKHGLMESRGGVSIEVAASGTDDRLQLTVSDDGAGLRDGHLAPGVGIGNVRARLRTMYGDRAALAIEPGPQGQGVRVTITLPVRTLATESDDKADTTPGSLSMV